MWFYCNLHKVLVLVNLMSLFAFWQLVEECYPANALSPEEELDVAFSSFPDSMSQGSTHASVHDCAFFFRIRRRGSTPAADIPAPPRRTVSHPVDQYVDVGAVDHTGKHLIVSLTFQFRLVSVVASCDVCCF
jgi:hypothetical protein